jgi:signal peptidase II
MIRNIVMAAAVASLALAVDQFSKWAILNLVMVPPRVIEVLPVFNLRLGFNTGVSFGLFSDTLDDWVGVLTLFKLAVAAGLLSWAALSLAPLERVGLSLMAGGAIGNAFDRWRQGAVTDFLDVHWGTWHFPTFNMADVAITCGVLCLLVGAVADHRRGTAVDAAKLSEKRP